MPLRERREDISMLAGYFIQKFGGKIATRRVRSLSSRARVLLENYPWPGKVRELENVIGRAVLLGTSELIMPEDLPESLLELATGAVPLDDYRAAVNAGAPTGTTGSVGLTCAAVRGMILWVPARASDRMPGPILSISRFATAQSFSISSSLGCCL